MEPSTPYSLLIAARDGQPEAWNRFVHLYGPLIYRWVRRTGLQSSDAADITQDVLMSVSKDLSKFDPTRAAVKFRAWLWTITRRRIADSYRNQPEDELLGSAIADLAQFGEEADPPTDPDLDSQTVLQRALAIHRNRFDTNSWTAFWATVVDGRQPAEVAETLGISRWAVYKARARILQRLRNELAGLVE
jgi:RNA polymerase sigma-70 factor (ECF subfamily)